MKYKVGDKVRIKSLDWYNQNKNEDGNVDCGEWNFTEWHTPYCGEVMTIRFIWEDYEYYKMFDSDNHWTDEMIEGLAEEPVLSAPNITEGVFMHEKDMKCTTEYILPDGYIFKDENGNVINTNKIVLEKQKKEYPKTYEECAMLLRLGVVNELKYRNLSDVYKKDLIVSIQKLLICRDAYWKIAGEEMGLSGSWKPDFASCKIKYAITYYNNVVSRYSEVDYNSTILVFPTEEMRDAFYENFKELIESCKELL